MRKSKDEVNQVSDQAEAGLGHIYTCQARLERVAQCSAKPLLQCATSASVMVQYSTCLDARSGCPGIRGGRPEVVPVMGR